MTDDVRRILEYQIDEAISLGYRMAEGLVLIEKYNSYMPPDENQPVCHPLETVILGENIVDAVNAQIASSLGMTTEWVDGFLAGYIGEDLDPLFLRLSKQDRIRKEYMNGYKDGEETYDLVREWEAECHSTSKILPPKAVGRAHVRA